MSLLDANGNPVSTPPQFSNEELVQVLSALRMRADSTNAQILQISMLVEYLFEELKEKGIDIDLEKFGEWSANRWAEIQKEAAEQLKAQGQTDLDEAAEGIEASINLDEMIESTEKELTSEEALAARTDDQSVFPTDEEFEAKFNEKLNKQD